MERWRKLGRKRLLLLPPLWVEDLENAFALLFRTGLAGAGLKLLDLMHLFRIYARVGSYSSLSKAVEV